MVLTVHVILQLSMEAGEYVDAIRLKQGNSEAGFHQKNSIGNCASLAAYVRLLNNDKQAVASAALALSSALEAADGTFTELVCASTLASYAAKLGNAHTAAAAYLRAQPNKHASQAVRHQSMPALQPLATSVSPNARKVARGQSSSKLSRNTDTPYTDSHTCLAPTKISRVTSKRSPSTSLQLTTKLQTDRAGSSSAPLLGVDVDEPQTDSVASQSHTLYSALSKLQGHSNSCAREQTVDEWIMTLETVYKKLHEIDISSPAFEGALLRIRQHRRGLQHRKRNANSSHENNISRAEESGDSTPSTAVLLDDCESEAAELQLEVTCVFEAACKAEANSGAFNNVALNQLARRLLVLLEDLDSVSQRLVALYAVAIGKEERELQLQTATTGNETQTNSAHDTEVAGNYVATHTASIKVCTVTRIHTYTRMQQLSVVMHLPVLVQAICCGAVTGFGSMRSPLAFDCGSVFCLGVVS